MKTLTMPVSISMTRRLLEQAAAVADATGTRRASVLRHACAIGLAELARQLGLEVAGSPAAAATAAAIACADRAEGR